MTKILQREEDILREKAKEVSVEEIDSPKIRGVLGDMREALGGQKDGVALAAPQIGYSYRIFVVSKKVFGEEKAKDMVFINPEIISQSRSEELMEEGCLSCRYTYGKVKRKEKTRVRAYDQEGEVFEYGGSGLMSQIFQHEIDHLNGILFIDKAEETHDINPKDLKLDE